MRRFFTERNNITVGSSVQLGENEAKHARDTLRMQIDDPVVLFNGEKEYQARLTAVNKKGVLAKVQAVLESNVIHAPEIHLFVAMIKPSNFEIVLQKATELGVASITPIITEYSQIRNEVYEKKYDRWQKIIIEACKQSESKTIPELNKIQPLSEVLEQNLIVLGLSRNGEITQKFHHSKFGEISADQTINLLIGPEGGFSETEYKLFNEHNLPIWELFEGTRILRAETAAIAGLSVAKALSS